MSFQGNTELKHDCPVLNAVARCHHAHKPLHAEMFEHLREEIAGAPHHEELTLKRTFAAIDWLVRVACPKACIALGAPDHAATLAALPEITDEASARAAYDTIYAAYDATFAVRHPVHACAHPHQVAAIASDDPHVRGRFLNHPEVRTIAQAENVLNQALQCTSGIHIRIPSEEESEFEADNRIGLRNTAGRLAGESVGYHGAMFAQNHNDPHVCELRERHTDENGNHDHVAFMAAVDEHFDRCTRPHLEDTKALMTKLLALELDAPAEPEVDSSSEETPTESVSDESDSSSL